MAASFIGCTLLTMNAELSPVKAARREAHRPTMDPILMLALASSWLRCLRRNQQLTATVNTAPMIHEEVTVWQNLSTAKGEKATSRKLVISKRIVSGLNC